MDGGRFDELVSALGAGAASRRLVSGLLTAGVLEGVLARWGLAGVEAQEPPSCRRRSEGCRRDRQCCSGVCKRGACRRAPGQGTCQGENSCGPVVKCNGNLDCECYVTTRGTSFCGDNLGRGCTACAANEDCITAGFPAGSVCVHCPGCAVTGDRLCAAPCR